MTRALLLLLALAAPAAALEVPFLSGRVNDHAGLLSPEAKVSLEAKLKDLEARKGHQVAVLTLDSLEGAPLEDFTLKVARTWELGRKGKNDGVLFLISKSDRKLRIEVGHGLEGSLPDALAGRIIQNEVVPRLRSGDFEGGVAAGVDAILGAIDGTYSPPAEDEAGSGDMDLPEKVMISVFVLSILGIFEFVGITAPGVGWFLYFFLIPFWTAFPMAIWGVTIGTGCLLAHLILFPILKLIAPHTALGKSMAKGGGGFSSGSGWSSGGSSGGFSGGGGSFGGGGSSGSW